jgi:hypothetical protein
MHYMSWMTMFEHRMSWITPDYMHVLLLVELDSESVNKSQRSVTQAKGSLISVPLTAPP